MVMPSSALNGGSPVLGSEVQTFLHMTALYGLIQEVFLEYSKHVDPCTKVDVLP